MLEYLSMTNADLQYDWNEEAAVTLGSIASLQPANLSPTEAVSQLSIV
jgi:hypothetical protein